MATSAARRPLPALAFLLALSLLTALVWWRVLHRSDSAKASTSTPSCSASATPTATVLPAAVTFTVTVLNSTQRSQLASQVTALLTADGFKTGTPANDLTTRAPVAGVAEIRYGPTGAGAAKLVLLYVPGATLVPDARTDQNVDLALGAKYNTLAAPSDVIKAMASQKLTQSAPPPASPSAAASGSTTPKPSTTPTTSPKSSPSSTRTSSSGAGSATHC